MNFEVIPQRLNQVEVGTLTPKGVFPPAEAIPNHLCLKSSSCCLINPLLSFSWQTDGLRVRANCPDKAGN